MSPLSSMPFYWYNEEYDGEEKRWIEKICGMEQVPIPGKPGCYRSKSDPPPYVPLGNLIKLDKFYEETKEAETS